ncbi:hypothetical protein NP493_900g00013 [Ridgeia piscesae]|uniref:Uncharacterized protein n=1 Tax=Ridgeia piscesae TaxID=27915 RepID=A0AAD9KL00_RIDPI|nr:hypothetical protein NP493_900g00013 [Ridgeia piscesae]
MRPNSQRPAISWLALNGITRTATRRSAVARDTMKKLAVTRSLSKRHTLTTTRTLPTTAQMITADIASAARTVPMTAKHGRNPVCRTAGSMVQFHGQSEVPGVVRFMFHLSTYVLWSVK